jgi:hypothetical protein
MENSWDPQAYLLRPCRNDLCQGLILGGAAYCCGPCASAHEGHYEIHEDGPLAHTAGCVARQAQRQP